MIQSIEWHKDHLRIIDQTQLPLKSEYIDLYTVEDVFESIQKLKIRGAPAIGIIAGYGLFLSVLNKSFSDENNFFNYLENQINYLASARPTAVNLEWSLLRIKTEIKNTAGSGTAKLKENLFEIAKKIHTEDKERCKGIAEHGQEIIAADSRILTHCNTGALATGGMGTALGIVHQAHILGKKVEVFATETRPLLQGARLTVWELFQSEIPVNLICDDMAAWLMNQQMVDLVIVGADRITADGSTANKIGTYNLAILSKYHDIPFYIAAPLSTFDMSLSSGRDIPIEIREENEVRMVFNQYLITVPRVKCWNPAFDVTPPDLISGIITEKGIIRPPYTKNIEKVFNTKILN